MNASWYRIPNSRGLEHERSLTNVFGVCSRNRKEPLAARPEKTGGLVGGKRGRQVRRKSAVEVVQGKSGNLVLYSICDGKRM